MSFVKVMKSMLDSMKIDDDLQILVAPLERLIVHWTDPVRLIVMGEFNAGKSTLINTLLGEEVIATGIVPTTAVATYLRYSKEKYIEIVYENGNVERKSIKEMEKLTSERNKEGKKQRENIQLINLYLPNPFLLNLVLIDTPGLGAHHSQHEIQASDAYKEADDSMWIFRYGSVGRLSEVNVLKKLKDNGLDPIGVVNMIDQSDEDDITPYLQYEFDKLGGRIRSLIGVSSIEAKEAQETIDQELLEISGFPKLLSLIDEIKKDKESRKYKRFETKFLSFWLEFTDAFTNVINSKRYVKSLMQIRNDTVDVEHENHIVQTRIAKEIAQTAKNNKQLVESIAKTKTLHDWVKRKDFKYLIEDIPQLKDWKEFEKLYFDTKKVIQNLINEVNTYEQSIQKEIGKEINYIKLIQTPKKVLKKYQSQRKQLIEKEKALNIKIKELNATLFRLQTEKNTIRQQIKDHYQSWITKREMNTINKVREQREQQIEANLKSQILLHNQIQQLDYLVKLQQKMKQVRRYVRAATLTKEFQQELPHLKEQRIVDETIQSLNAQLKNEKDKLQQTTIKLDIQLPKPLEQLNVVPKKSLRNIRPLFIASVIPLVVATSIMFKDSFALGDIRDSFAPDEEIISNNEPTDQNEYAQTEIIGLATVSKTSGEQVIVYENANDNSAEIGNLGDQDYEIMAFTENGWMQIGEDAWVFYDDEKMTLYQQQLKQRLNMDYELILRTEETTVPFIPVFSENSRDSAVVGYLENSSYVDIYELSNSNWAKIGQSAWIESDKYLTIDWNFDPVADGKPIGTLTVNTPKLNVREEDFQQSNLLGTLPNGTKVDVYEISDSTGWYRIGEDGWVTSDPQYSSFYQFYDYISTYETAIGTARILIDLHVRVNENSASESQGILRQGQVVNVYEISADSGWYRIGTDAWISNDGQLVAYEEEGY
ncbi:SH3 domain-containing protein [Ureibacillus xyleni]|uniref:SH3 domain-containing protein n=1 Tax=Ureibacillus xyleni TaxID=614648 RepID=A0A285TME5_9BACL|nr:dynamin family protein [Ureibacillus xyleni]SOC23902.1 SH3 domain-containing protein [Ureibacillus xyleni]